MPDYDPRRLSILKTMGVDVWSERPRAQDQSHAVIHERQESRADTPAQPIASSSPVKPDAAAAEFPELAAVHQAISGCVKCKLHSTRTNTVPGSGHAQADWMFIGEGPGQNEDLQGLPFVGRAGQLLTAMINALGMQRHQVFIANVVKCRPPNNRDPDAEEVAACEPFLMHQLDIIEPEIIVALGRVSAQVLLKSSAPLGKLRGTVHRFGPNSIPLVATYHPAYLLRSPQQKKLAWQDLLLAQSQVPKA